MSERYQKLFALSENLYAESAPLLIAAGALLKDNQTGKVLAQIKFKNISAKTIKAVKVSVNAFDVSGAELQGVAEHQYLDLSAARDTEFGQKNAIILPDKVTRSFSCECKSVVFSDGTGWEANGAEWRTLIQPQALQKKLGGLVAQYRRDTVKQAQFVATDDRDLWICACGVINRQDEEKCHACHSEKTALLAALDTDILKKHNDEYNKVKAEREAKQAEEDKKKKAKTKKISIIAAACAAVVIAAIVVITQVIVPSGKYNTAVALMNEGKYDEAIDIFEELGDYRDSAEKVAIKDIYKDATDSMETSILTAYELLNQLPDDYKDVAELKEKCELYIPYCGYFNWGSKDGISFYSDFHFSDDTTVYWDYDDDGLLTITVDNVEYPYFGSSNLVTDMCVTNDIDKFITASVTFTDGKIAMGFSWYESIISDMEGNILEKENLHEEEPIVAIPAE